MYKTSGQLGGQNKGMTSPIEQIRGLIFGGYRILEEKRAEHEQDLKNWTARALEPLVAGRTFAIRTKADAPLTAAGEYIPERAQIFIAGEQHTRQDVPEGFGYARLMVRQQDPFSIEGKGSSYEVVLTISEKNGNRRSTTSIPLKNIEGIDAAYHEGTGISGRNRKVAEDGESLDKRVCGEEMHLKQEKIEMLLEGYSVVLLPRYRAALEDRKEAEAAYEKAKATFEHSKEQYRQKGDELRREWMEDDQLIVRICSNTLEERNEEVRGRYEEIRRWVKETFGPAIYGLVGGLTTKDGRPYGIDLSDEKGSRNAALIGTKGDESPLKIQFKAGETIPLEDVVALEGGKYQSRITDEERAPEVPQVETQEVTDADVKREAERIVAGIKARRARQLVSAGIF